ncbi:MAG TPA: homocysteine S-methyltransferase family protein [Gaiellaceae bacterium]
MSYRAQLPQLSGETFITDGGMETTLIFDDGIALPDFASFILLDDASGIDVLRAYYTSYLEIAAEHGVGIVLDTPTWRANPDWGDRLGYSAAALADVDRRGVALLEELRATAEGVPHVIISGCIGPRGDGYRVDNEMTSEEAQRYHEPQVATFADTAADLVSALTLTYADEAVGVARAARDAGIPSVISFTVETDGRLPSGQPLREAIEEVDGQTQGVVAYFMINCAHPTHFAHVLEEGGDWRGRIRGLRANASEKSHAELDEAEELDPGDPAALARHYRELQTRLPSLTVVGGCCGTNHRHVAEICTAVTA